jgi:oligopeptide transport system substrate-binding protein
MRFSRTSKALGLAAVVAMSLSACGGGTDSGNTATGDTTKVISANSTEPENGLLPADTNEVGGGRVMDLIFTGLVSYDVSGRTVNELAESIETTDSQNYTIKIKSGETFSDGTPVTAKSFVDAWNFGAAAKNAQKNSYFFESIKGYDTVSAEGSTAEAMEGLKVVDDTTFTVELAQAESDFPLRLGYTAFYPLPESAYADSKAFGQNPIGNGPYVLAKDGWKHDVSISLVPNDKYKGPRKAKNGGVNFTIYASTDAAYTDVQSDNLDVLDQVPPSQLQNFSKDFDARNVNQPYAGIATLTIPSYLEQFSGEAGLMRRQAISMAIDRQQIIDKIFYGNKKIAKDFTSPVIDGYSDSIPGSEVVVADATKAKDLWAKAEAISKWDNTKPFTIAYNVDGAGNKEYVDAAANQIKNTLGIAAEGKPFATFKELRQAVNEKKLTGAARAGWQADYPSLYNFLGPLYGTGAGSNDGNYSNPAFDAKLKEGLAASSVEAGNKLFNESQEILFKDLPVLPLWYQAVQGVWSNNVTDVKFSWNGVPVYNEITAK